MPTTSAGAPGANPFEQARIAARQLARLTGADRHDVLVVLGTGLASVAPALGAQGPPLDLTSLPWTARCTGPGHRHAAWSLTRGSLRVLVAAGRLHLYEGRTPAEVVHLLRTAVAGGVHTVLLTCSAGAVAASYAPGDVVAIKDHMDLARATPLRGVTSDPPLGTRHVDMTDAWSPRLREVVHAVDPVPEGVYAQVLGPQLETPAEIRMLAALGADLVGMSMVPEVIAARHLGAQVLGLAVVTNAAAGAAQGAAGLRVESIVETAEASAERVGRILDAVVQSLASEPA